MSDKLPPKVPSTTQDLNRAIDLLGSRVQGHDLKFLRQEELRELIGTYPDPVNATAYKRAFKALVKASDKHQPPDTAEATQEAEKPPFCLTLSDGIYTLELTARDIRIIRAALIGPHAYDALVSTEGEKLDKRRWKIARDMLRLKGATRSLSTGAT